MGIHHSAKITPVCALWYFNILDRAVESHVRVWNYCPRSGVLTHMWFVAISPYFAVKVSRGWHLYWIKTLPQLRSRITAKACHSTLFRACTCVWIDEWTRCSSLDKIWTRNLQCLCAAVGRYGQSFFFKGKLLKVDSLFLCLGLLRSQTFPRRITWLAHKQ